MNIDAVSAGTLPLDTEKRDADLNGVLDRDAFLQLLVTQLRYQNPINPMNNEQFITQSAAFSSLEEIRHLNANVEALIQLQESSSRTAGLSLIGKNVTAYGQDISCPYFGLSDGSPASLSYSLSADANVTITILDASGTPIRGIDAGHQSAGDHSFVWDGLNDQGIQVPDGSYSYKVSAIDADGNYIDASETISGVVDGLVAFQNELLVSIGGLRVPLWAVTEVWADTGEDL